MFDPENVTEYASFIYWFQWKSDDEWYVYECDSGKYVGVYVPSKKLVRNAPEGLEFKAVKVEFDKFVEGRPEYWVGNLTKIHAHIDEPEEVYEALIVGCALVRAKKRGLADVDKAIPQVMKCLDWIRKTDFYAAPASTQYHDSYPGGLLHHTLNVVRNIIDLHKLDKFKDVQIEDAILIALVHDWCKIGLYESYDKNVKNEKTGVWEKQRAYRHRGEIVPLGHGAESMFLASKFFGLMQNEACAIRWHMGEYNVAPNEMNALHSANEQFPLVFMIQFADRLSITNY